MPQHPCARRLEPGPLGRCQDQALCGCGWQGRCPMRSVCSQDKPKGGDERAARISPFVLVSQDPCIWDFGWHVCTSEPCAPWQWRQQALAPEHGCAVFPGQNVTSQTSRTVVSHQLLTLSFFGLCSPLLSSVFSPRRSSVALCLCPPHPSSHLVCSSVTVSVKAPPGLPLDGVSENQGCHWPLRPHPFPYTRPGLQHGRCRVSPTGNPGQFETCLCTDSVLHTKPREALSVLDLCPARGRAHKFSLEEMLNAPLLGEKSWALLGWGKARLKMVIPTPGPCLDASVLRPALQVSPSIRNQITRPADLALCPLYPCLVPPWPLVSPESFSVCHWL